MRLYAYRDRQDCERFGVLVDGRLLTGRRLEEDGGLEWGASHMGIGFLLATRRRGLGDVERAARKAVKRGAPTLDLESRRPAPALGHPWTGKIVCVGLNYGDHATEGGRAVPARPMLFSKFANAIVGDGEAIVRPEGTRALDLEVELGVVIGAPARRVTPAQAMDHVAGYVVVNDVSARDWQGNPQALREGEKGDGQWLRAKGSDTFLPVGPDFVTTDELDPRDGLRAAQLADPRLGRGRRHAGPDAGREHRRHALRRARAGELHLAVRHARARRPHRHRHAGGRRRVPRSAGLPRARATASGARSRASAWWRIRSSTGPRTRVRLPDARGRPRSARREPPHARPGEDRARTGALAAGRPGPRLGINDVLIRVHKTGICGTDLHIESWDPWAAKTIQTAAGRRPRVRGRDRGGRLQRRGLRVRATSSAARAT